MKNPLKGTLLCLLGVLIITPDTLLLRLIDGDTMSVVFWRGLFTFVSVLMYLIFMTKIDFLLSLKQWNRYDSISLICFMLGNTLFVYAINHGEVATTLILLSTAPFFASILSHLFLHERITLTMLLGIICCFIGVLIILSEKWLSPSAQPYFISSWLSVISALICAMTIAVNFTLSRSEKQSNILLVFAFAGMMTALCYIPFVENLHRPILNSLSWMLLDGLVVVPVAFILVLIGARYIPSPYSTMMFQLEVFLGPLWVWLVLHEFPGRLTFMGGSVIVSTLIAVNLYALYQSKNQDHCNKEIS